MDYPVIARKSAGSRKHSQSMSGEILLSLVQRSESIYFIEELCFFVSTRTHLPQGAPYDQVHTAK